jgi:hypothetical protein
MLPTDDVLVTTVWEQRRNTTKATVNWRFTTPAARTKLQRLYPS